MPQDNPQKPVRIFFAQTGASSLPTLTAALRSASEFSLSEYSGPPEEIWVKAIAFSGDVTILFFPEIGPEHELCIKTILLGCYSRVILITNASVGESFKNTGRISIYPIPKTSRAMDDIIQSLKFLGAKNRIARPAETAEAGKKLKTAAHEAEAKILSLISGGTHEHKIVAVGASTGGTEALTAFLHGLKPPMPGMVVVQHMPPVFTAMFAERLNRELPFDVVEAEDHRQILKNSIHIAPGDRHLKIRKVGSAYLTVVGGTNKVTGHCPSVDVLFDSVAEAAGANAVGIIMTGMGSDGAKGLLKMRQSGAFTIGQDEASSIVYGMPMKAFELGAVVRQVALKEIAPLLVSHLGK